MRRISQLTKLPLPVPLSFLSRSQRLSSNFSNSFLTLCLTPGFGPAACKRLFLLLLLFNFNHAWNRFYVWRMWGHHQLCLFIGSLQIHLSWENHNRYFFPLLFVSWIAFLVVCLVSFCCGLFFSTNSGAYWVDLFDRYIVAFTLFVVVGFECVIFSREEDFQLFFLEYFFQFAICIHTSFCHNCFILKNRTPSKLRKIFWFLYRWIIPPISGILLIVTKTLNLQKVACSKNTFQTKK